MLRDFRKIFKDNGTTMGALMVVLSGGMLLYLVPSGQANTTPDSIVARVYGHEVVMREVNDTVQQMAQRYGKGANADQLMAFLAPQAVQQLVQAKLIEELAERHGVIVTDPEVKSAVESRLSQYPVLLDPTTHKLLPFDQLKSILQENNFSLVDFERKTRDDLTREKLVEQAALLVPVDALWVDEENRLRNEKVTFQQATLKPDTASISDPGDATLQTFLQQSGARFLQPVRRVVQFVSLDKAALAKDIAVSDAEVQKAYDSRSAQYATAPQVQARHILFKASNDAEYAAALKKAQDLRVKLTHGLDFAKAAEEFSEDPSAKGRGGDLGWFDASKMVKEFSDAAFKLKKGEISEPVKTSFGIHLIQVEDTKPGQVTPFDQVKDKLKAQLEDDRFTAKATERLENLKKKANNGDLGNAARAVGLDVKLSQPFANNPGLILTGITGSADAILNSAFTLKVGAVSTVSRVGDAYILFRVQKEVQPVVAPLSEIRAQVLTAWKEDQARTALQAKAEAALKNGGVDSLQTIGGTVQTLTDTTLSAHADLASNSRIRRTLLDTAIGQTTPLLWTEDGSLVVMTIKSRTPAPALTFETRRALVQDIQTQEAQQLLGAEAQNLQEQGKLHPGFSSLWGRLNGIWVNDAAVQQLQGATGAGDDN